MLYKFKTSASGDVIMLGPDGDKLLRLLGREPAPKGIIEPQDMPQALAALQAAIAAESAAAPVPDTAAADAERVGLHRRLWPMIEMLRRAHAADAAVVWGV